MRVPDAKGANLPRRTRLSDFPERILPRLRLNRHPPQAGEFRDASLTAEPAHAAALHAAERHLRLLVHRRRVHVADAGP